MISKVQKAKSLATRHAPAEMTKDNRMTSYPKNALIFIQCLSPTTRVFRQSIEIYINMPTRNQSSAETSKRKDRRGETFCFKFKTGDLTWTSRKSQTTVTKIASDKGTVNIRL